MGSQVITTTGASTWNWPTAVTTVVVELVGGGGAGGGATGNPAAGGGGKGGGYSKKTITKGAESFLTITVGTGGVGGTSANGAAAKVSTVTQDGSIIQTATAGASAVAGVTTVTGAGATTEIGTASGDVVFSGGNGGTGSSTVTGAGGGAAGPSSVGGNASGGTAGARGTGTFGDGGTYNALGAAGQTAAASAGIVGVPYGGGGSGGRATSNPDRAGGSGAQGIAVLTWTDPPQYVLNQKRFRFYGNQPLASATPLADENTNITVDLSNGNAEIQLRLQLEDAVSGTLGSYNGAKDEYVLQYRLNSGSWARYGAIRGDQLTAASASAFNTVGRDGIAGTFYGDGRPVTSVTMRSQFGGGTNPTGVMATCQIFASTGLSQGVPTGAALATSTAVNEPNINGVNTTFQFPAGSVFTPTDGVVYWYAWIRASADTVNYPAIWIEAHNPIPNDQWGAYRTNGTWGYGGYSSPCARIQTDETSAPVKSSAAGNIFESTNSGSELLNPAANGSYQPGITSAIGANNIVMTTGGHMEVHYAFLLDAGLLSNGDVLQFRVVRSRNLMDTYTVTPQITISSSGVTGPSVATLSGMFAGGF